MVRSGSGGSGWLVRWEVSVEGLQEDILRHGNPERLGFESLHSGGDQAKLVEVELRESVC
ncbi:hypothetical protein AAU01_04110 [Paenarthrobacter aurescens]|uniref:Uncharacterized protein n=1 Tax=Paenarthrobacter aurescens TaxID=43663 RepID=A0A4Y3NES7_PAEAU|nr:hypothetical protein AAU01_04110 [Paenarthrobacter aurescens]